LNLVALSALYALLEIVAVAALVALATGLDVVPMYVFQLF